MPPQVAAASPSDVLAAFKSLASGSQHEAGFKKAATTIKKIPDSFIHQTARAYTELCFALYAEIMGNPREKAMARLRAADTIMAYGWGRAPMIVKVDSGHDPAAAAADKFADVLRTAASNAAEALKPQPPALAHNPPAPMPDLSASAQPDGGQLVEVAAPGESFSAEAAEEAARRIAADIVEGAAAAKAAVESAVKDDRDFKARAAAGIVGAAVAAALAEDSRF